MSPSGEFNLSSLFKNMKNADSLGEIYAFRQIGDKLGTAGQPTEEQLRSVREAGFEAVVNLALPTIG